MAMRKNKKIFYSVLIVLFILLLSYALPSLARFKERGAASSSVWTGSVASKYRSGSGSRNNPYIISNGDELAFFSSQLENNDYEGKYFKIVNNILINEGMFKYELNKIKYIVGNNTYYVNGNKYYDNAEFTGDEVGTLNEMPNLNGFKGSLYADYHVIYGYYSDTPLFTSLNGDVSSLFMENALVVSNGSTALFADTINGSDLTDIVVDGYVVAPTYVEPTPEPVQQGEGNPEPVVLSTIDLLSDYDNFESSIVGGIAVYANDSTLINCINKANIIGGFIAGGIVGYSNDSSIVNAYTTGAINSNISTAVGVVKGTGVIDRLYSTSSLTNGSLIGYVTDAEVEVNNSFITTDSFLLLDTKDSTITAQNNYYVSAGKGDNLTSTLATTSDLKNPSFLSSYSNFVSKTDLNTHPLNVWIFDNESYPILYFDDVVNNYVELHVNSSNMWNSFSHNLNIYKLTNNLTIMISDVDNVHTSDKYYYINNSQTPLTLAELQSVEWTPYSDVVVLNEEGFYIVYVKTVDNNSNIKYINSDVLILDNTASDISIEMGANAWHDLTNGNYYLDRESTLSVSATDTLSGVKSVEYHLANSRVNNIENVNWTPYSAPIGITTVGDYILYVRVIDNCDLVSYASTPLIIYDGYTVNNLKPIGFIEGSTITKKSSIIFDISYSNNRELSLTHNLVTSTALPLNTKITMLDKTNNKVYEYTVNADLTRYPFTSFKEVGKLQNDYYVEGNRTNESYTFILDFSNCDIENDYRNVSIHLEGVNNNDIIRPSIHKSSFNILSSGNVELTHNLTTEFNGSITYNSDSSTEVTISNNVTLNGAYDTKYADKKTGLAIKIVDSEGNIITSNNLKNIIFKIGNDKYAPDEDNIIRINLNTNTTTSVTLSIITYDGVVTLDEGTYYIKIYGYASYDGIYYSDTTDPITIPLVVGTINEINNRSYSFDVLLDSDNRIVDKGDVEVFNFRVLQEGLTSPNIKVSLYQKDQLTAYNQDYTLIDMQDYTSDQLDEFIDNVYYVTRNARTKYTAFNYSLDTTDIDKTAYKFVFDLYDGNIKVESIVKYIIIR